MNTLQFVLACIEQALEQLTLKVETFSQYALDHIWTTILVATVIAVVLGNFKNLPGLWHARIFSALFQHFIVRRFKHVSVAKHGGQALFAPVRESTRSPLFECDFNGHKSDSTYYSDLDSSRIHLLATLFKPVLDPAASKSDAGHGIGKLSVALGGVSCTFKREIKPYEAYDVWSRVLTWDDKWLYIVSHFTRKAGATGQKFGSSQMETEAKDVIFASAISKYVFKRGRKTIPADQVLLALQLVPTGPKPKEPCMAKDGTLLWDYKMVQEEKRKGYEIAQGFAALDALHATFTGSSSVTLDAFER